MLDKDCITATDINTSQSVQETIKKSNLLNEKVAAKCRETEEIIKDITHAHGRPVSSKSPFVISFVGRFKTGKSSLINALIGAEILPTRAITATSVITKITYGAIPKCWLRSKHEKTEVSIDEGREIILNYKTADINNPTEVIFELPIPWIKDNVELRDTPGMDDSSQNGRLETFSLNTLKDTDLVVCVFDAGAIFSAKERERTQAIHKMMSGNVVYVVNCINRVNSIENMHDVENLAKSFFGTMSYSMPGMGKYYMICSAPKMIELDEFDLWLQNLVGTSDMSMLNQIRKNTGLGKVIHHRDKFSFEATKYMELMEQQLHTLTKLHEDLTRQRQRTSTHSVQNAVAELRRKTGNLANAATEISSDLRERIQECKSKGNDYENNTKSATENYFIERYKTAVDGLTSYFRKDYVRFINQIFGNISFPGIHKTTVKATKGEKNGWTIAGTVIGTVIAPGIGSLIGAALGRGIGASDTMIDDSADNTMRFIENTIVPLLKKAINERISTVIRAIKDNGNIKCSSGLETIISETSTVKQLLNKYRNDD